MNIVEKLNKMNINDLKSIDYMKLVNTLKERPDMLVSMAAIALALFMSFRIYTGNLAQTKSLRTEIKSLEEKTLAITKYKKAQAELNKFIDEIPEPMNPDHLMDLLTDFAVKRHVQIESFLPAPSRGGALYEMAGINLNISTEDYKNLWLFIQDIEVAPQPIYINKLRLSPLGQNSQINIQLDIALVNLKK